MKNPTAIKNYIFQKDLHNTPLALTTAKHKSGKWITILENIPTKSFRGDMHKQDLLAAHETWAEAKKFHAEKVKETKGVLRGDE